MTEQLPVFATNRDDTGQTVAAEVNRMFRMLREEYTTKPRAAIATAYINPGGFALLADELEQVPRVRLLLGAEPEQETVRRLAVAADDNEAEYDARLSQALGTHEGWLRAERDTMGFDREVTSSAQRMVEWLRAVDPSGTARVEVRRYTDGFLHGKAYLADHPKLPGVIAGSSNFTFAGLSRNAELNLGYPTGEYTDRVIDWFEHYWANSDEYDLAGLYAEQWEPHAPWTVFLRMLLELYGAHLDEERAASTELQLTQFQSDGVQRMERLLGSLGGVLVADEVGLGKTYLAGEVIRRVNTRDRQRVLVIAPASLKAAVWEPFLKRYDYGRLTQVMSYEEVRNRFEDVDAEFRKDVEETALIVVDEAHNLRNAGAQRSKAIDQVILAGANPKKVVLLTATPVNNSLADLETLIRYFVRDDAHFASIGIPSIHEYIRSAQKLDAEALTPEHLFDLMDQVAVRRTRKFVKDHYPNTRVPGPGGTEITVRFPQPEAYRIDYPLTVLGRELIDRMVHALDRPDDEELFLPADEAPDPERLTLARYTASGYRRDRERPDEYQIANAGLLRSALLKRLESSPYALQSTLETLATSHRAFLEGLARGYVLRGDALRDWGTSDSDDLEAFVDQLDEDQRDQAESVALFDLAALRTAVESDLNLLRDLRALTMRSLEEQDAKADRLVAELERIALEARRVDRTGLSSRDRRKVLVFSTFSDTVVPLHEHVSRAVGSAPEGSPLADYRGRIAEPVMGAYKSVQQAGHSGGVDQGGRRQTIEGFAPRTAGPLHDDGTPIAEDRFDLLITTDVLAEGVNLQQAGRIINYDLPWNPMRIVQRHGRIDRIGSPHEVVQLGLFFPAERLDEMLGLEATLERKLAQADAAVGAGGVLPGRRSSDSLTFTDRDRAVAEIEGLLESRGSSAALSGEEYRRRLANALQDSPRIRTAVEALPFGSGSGLENPRLTSNGYVFCVRIGDEPKPWFRWVECDAEWRPIGLLSDDTLASLVAADPGGSDAERWMSDEAYDRVFDAWAIAREEVFRTWDRLTDPSALRPELPAAFREARSLVQQAGRFLPADERQQLIGKLQSVPTFKVQRAVRAALNEEGSDEDRIRAVQREVEAAGLQVPPPPKPLPPVAPDDVRLICWMAVRGTGG